MSVNCYLHSCIFGNLTEVIRGFDFLQERDGPADSGPTAKIKTATLKNHRTVATLAGLNPSRSAQKLPHFREEHSYVEIKLRGFTQLISDHIIKGHKWGPILDIERFRGMAPRQ